MGKLIVVCAPSGSGKSTIIGRLMAADGKRFAFSISATSRAPRGNEVDGKEYYFMSVEEFKERVKRGDFIEYQEVYPGCFYGTLKSEVERAWADGKVMFFDVDVKGGMDIKRLYGEQCLALFIQPPSVEELRRRLVARGTDSMEMIERRVAKAEEELGYAPQFDVVVVNDDLERAVADAKGLIDGFLQD